MPWTHEAVAIINRGEPAMRLIHGVREFNREHGTAIRTVALYTEPDRNALFVRQADRAVSLGPALSVDPADGALKSSYLRYDLLERILREEQVGAAWVGWGFVAEHAAFADLCDRLGVVFLGPTGDVMRRLGDKISSKLVAEEARVPVAPWSGGAVDSVEAAHVHAEQLGYPLMIKATAGGGGRGIRKVTCPDELAPAFDSARNEALKAFGDATVFLETMVTGARHVEVQAVCDGQGGVWALGVRDCSVQRRNQKVIEESPSPGLTEAQHTELLEAAARLCRLVGYRGAGTVEFLFDPVSGTFSFMEVNARLQVEHPVTELVTGADLVKLQLSIGRGGRLEGDPPPPRGHAIEVRLNAEDPDNGFAPAPGEVMLVRTPLGPGVRVDSGIEAGDEVPPDFDSMVAKILAHGATRAEAIARIERALTEGSFVLRGGTTNKALLLDLLRHPDFRAGAFDVGWLDGLVAEGPREPHPHAALALAVAAVEAYDSELAVDLAAFLASAARGRPELSDAGAREVEISWRGVTYAFEVRRLGPERYRVSIGGRGLDLQLRRYGEWDRSVVCCGRRHRALAVADGPNTLVEIDGVPFRVEQGGGGIVRAPAPAVVVSIAVEEGDLVEPGDRLLVVEAMKMETAITARFAGVVRQVLATPNVQVAAGVPLLKLAPAGETTSEEGTRVDFAHLEPVIEDDDVARIRTLRDLMLGYDVAAGDLAGATVSEELVPDEATVAAEDELLGLYLDLEALFDHRPLLEASGQRLSWEQCLFVYLRDPLSEAEDLPARFVSDLQRALAHYGVDELAVCPALEQALFRIFRAHQRSDERDAVALAILQRRLRHHEVLRERAGDGFRRLLLRLVRATRSEHTTLHGCALELNYRYYEQRLLAAASTRAYATAEAHLAELGAEGLSEQRRRELVAALVANPRPLKSFVSRRYGAAARGLRLAMLEVMLRRYYRSVTLDEVRPVGGLEAVQAAYELDGRAVSVFALHPSVPGLGEGLAELAPAIDAVPDDHDVVVEVYLWEDRSGDSGEAFRSEVVRALDTSFGRRPSRVVVALSTPDLPVGRRHVAVYTFLADEQGYVESRVRRHMHPLVARRHNLYRLDLFELERLPAAEDVYLFHAVARTNPRDERLLASVEIRDLSVVRDSDGRLVGVPTLRHAFMEAMAGIRHFQWRRSARTRTRWNRVYLHVWPVVTLADHEVDQIVRSLMPETLGLGLEKVVVVMRVPAEGGGTERVHLEIGNPAGTGAVVSRHPPKRRPLQPMDRMTMNVVRLKRRGLFYPYELIRLLTPSRDGVRSAFPPGRFTEYDLDDAGALVPVERPPGGNTANVVVGVIESFTERHPEGMKRVAVFGDPSGSMGSLAEPECARILGCLDLAEALGVPLEWYAVSAGARISMESGTENMDWIARVLRRLVHFTQAGHEVNVLVLGVNVGAQPYWNAEATMLMHTRGVLIMTEQAAMVLTGKQALDYSGGVSAENNLGIGGYERIMGPNGQAQYLAHDVPEACRILLRYYEHTYVVPGERFPRPAASSDPVERDVGDTPHGAAEGTAFRTIAEVFGPETNPGRKKPFDIRQVMRATLDADHEPLERWTGMRDAEVAVVWDAHLGGQPISMIGLESRPLRRLGFVPADGPTSWTAGTLFPEASKKVARALNAASGRRPVVVLANLSGFDGSPESMRRLQLEYGAEIGRAVVNFDGPIVFCVISRYHGGAFVVFSAALNDEMEVSALEGAHASVIGGAPAAAVVFAREVRKRAHADPRIRGLQAEIDAATGAEAAALRGKLATLFESVHSEKLGEMAKHFDQVHSVHRALEVGSIHKIVAPSRLRPYLVDAVRRGMARTLARD